MLPLATLQRKTPGRTVVRAMPRSTYICLSVQFSGQNGHLTVNNLTDFQKMEVMLSSMVSW